jgi:hypothetical protein
MPAFVKWKDIHEIFAVKVDTGIINDLICVGIRFENDGYFIQVDELHPEFQKLMTEIGVRFPLLTAWQEVILRECADIKVRIYGDAFDGTYRCVI